MSKWKWINDLLVEKKISQAEFAKEIGWQQARVSELISDKRDIPANKLYNIANFLNIDLGKLTAYNSGKSEIIPLPHQLGTAAAADKIVSTVSSWFKKNLPDTVEIAMLDVSACCGSGAENFSENVVGVWQMPLADLKNITAAAPEHIKIVRAVGDSMQPTINDGDFVFVDTSSQSMTSDGIYVISSAAGLAVKRLQNGFTGDIIVRSDNKAYDPLSFSLSDLHLLGRVVYILNAKKV